MDLGEHLRELARNLYWTWHPKLISIFRDLDPGLWREVNHNPVEFLSRLPEETIEEKAAELALETRIIQAFHEMQDYLESTTTWGARRSGPLRATPVAYFSAEFGLHESLPTYAGGLGVLAGDHLKAASDLGVPLVGVGLFYAKGYFRQRLDADGWQQEEYLQTDVNMLPMESATDDDGNPLTVTVSTRQSDIEVKVWTAAVGRCRLVLLDSAVEGNSEQDRELTSRLYGGDSRTRIRQELILGVGGMRALRAMGIRPGVIHMNEGHSAFGVLEMARQTMEEEGRPFDQVRERTAGHAVFTTHTPVEAGHDRFAPDLVEETVGPLRDALGIDKTTLLALGRTRGDDDGEPFCMTVLGLKMARRRNAVSALHGHISRAMWHDLWPDRAEEEVPIGHITNGVHMATWLAAPMGDLYRRLPGGDWRKRMHDPELWAAVDDMDEVEFWEQHQMLKTHLVEYVRRHVCAQERGEPKTDGEKVKKCLDPSALTIGWARRLAGYKRADLLLRDMERLDRLVNDEDRPVQFVFAGKAHPNNDYGKKLIQKLFQVMHDPTFAGRFVFIENYDINVCRHLVQGVDLWLNTPRRPLEACGTSGQKVLLNGGLNLSTLDGWWVEAYDGANGFAIGDAREHTDDATQDAMDTESLYRTLEEEVVPLFYDRDDMDVPRRWIARQKDAIRTLPWRFNARRMIIDYTARCYMPAVGASTANVGMPG